MPRSFPLFCILVLAFCGPIVNAATKSSHKTAAGTCYEIDPAFLPDIQVHVDKLRAEMLELKKADRLLAYLSVPISPSGGGNFHINNEIAAATAKALRDRFGEKLWVLNPAAYSLREGAGGAEYMVLWSEILATRHEDSPVFDLVYFQGPTDVAAYFGMSGDQLISDLDRWIGKRTKTDSRFAADMAKAGARQAFVRFYSLRASTVYSKGAHDEWNLIQELNAGLETPDQIAVYYDGRAVDPGSFGDSLKPGYEKPCPSAPGGALGKLDQFFLDAYASRRHHSKSAQYPTIVISGSNMSQP